MFVLKITGVASIGRKVKMTRTNFSGLRRIFHIVVHLEKALSENFNLVVATICVEPVAITRGVISKQCCGGFGELQSARDVN